MLPVYTNNAPGGVLYAEIGGLRTVVCENPQSLYFHKATANGAGAVLDIAGISEDLSARKAFTVEYFVQLNAANWFASLQYASAGDGFCVSLPENTENAVRFYRHRTAVVATNPTKGGTDVSVKPSASLASDGAWHHVAVVYACGKDADGSWNADGEGTLDCYFDYALVGTLTFTNAAWTAEAVSADSRYPYPLSVGCALGERRRAPYPIHGSISGLRISSAALAPEAFLRAAVAQENTTVGLWPFTDGAPGTDATSITNNLGTLALAAGEGAALSTSLAAGVLPQFDADAPGKYVYDSTNAVRCVVEGPQSLRFGCDGSVVANTSVNVGGGMVAFPGLGTVISALDDYTIELFFKNEDASQWPWASYLFGFEDGTGTSKKENEVALSTVKNGTTSWWAAYSVGETDVATFQQPTSWRDGRWHHLALVHSGEGDASTLYVDYEKQTASEGTHQNALRTGVEFVLGTRYRTGKRDIYTFHGKISCLRVTSAALPPENFLQATSRRRGGGLSIIIR